MKNSNFETLVKPVIVLVVICIITSAALAFTNSVFNRCTNCRSSIH